MKQRSRRPDPAGSSRARLRRDGQTSPQLRQRICVEAARIMAEEGVTDHRLAKQKALRRLHLDPACTRLPGNREIQAALEEHLRLFQAGEAARHEQRLCQVALRAMNFLRGFGPRLVGDVVKGIFTRHSIIQLHLFPDHADELVHFLNHHQIPFECSERRLRFGGSHYERVPVYRFLVENTPVELIVLRPGDKPARPLDPVTARPVRRLSLRALEKSLDSGP